MPKIAVAEGDGIGKEVIPVAVRVLAAVRPDLEFFPVEVGYGRWERTGEAITPAEIRAMKEADAVLFGAVTTPPDPNYRSVVVRMRKELDLYANVRPVRGGDADIVIVRENTEGLYSGIEEVGPDRATTLRLVTRKGSERIARFACGLAKGRRHLTVGHKANVLKADTLFREACIAAAAEAGVPVREKFIDALCLDVLQHPRDYDVIVTENMFGDILSDVAAYLVGGLGMLPSGNIGDRHALFEPVHGSAPKHAGRNTANPVAAVRSGAMLLGHLGDREGEARIERAIGRALSSGVKTRDLGGAAGTREMGEAIVAALGERPADRGEPCLD
ncbi:MAG TPA: isocitrate/isopropylmalate dehydrogenase family protein [Methanomicrobiales archaeon]|nr:isocitrate/isopropylmalate dehydrogenase family protein [Methanomicrobiales archaeon]